MQFENQYLNPSIKIKFVFIKSIYKFLNPQKNLQLYMNFALLIFL